MKDNWCRPITLEGGRTVSGGAARNVRLAKVGGVDQLLRDFLDSVDQRIYQDAPTSQRAAGPHRPATPRPTQPGMNQPMMH